MQFVFGFVKAHDELIVLNVRGELDFGPLNNF